MNSLELFLDGDDDVERALFGREAIESWKTLDGVRKRPVRQPDGLWRGPRGPRNQHVSAVLVGAHVEAWGLARAKLWLVENPWALRPLTLDLPGARRGRVRRGDGFVTWSDPARTLLDAFGLPESWPNRGWYCDPSDPSRGWSL